MRSFIRFKDRFSSRGSFLISTALFLVAASMVGVVLLRMYQMFDYNKKLHTSQQRLEAVQEAMEVYYQRNTNRYPCPADPRVPADNARFGREATAFCGVGADGTVRVPGRGGNFVRIGALPTRDLGLSDSYALDKWGNKLIYAVTEDYAEAAPPAPNIDAGAIEIRDELGNSATSQPQNAIYIVLTHGPDRRGAYNLSGQRPIPCAAAGLAAENCDDDALFVNTANKSYDPNIGPNTYTYSAVFRANMLGFDWAADAWGACAGDCVNGNQTRLVECRDTLGAVLGTPLAPGPCAARGPAPAQTQACTAFTCAWVTGAFGACTATCGKGDQQRKVHCARSDGFGAGLIGPPADPQMVFFNPTPTPAQTPASTALATAQCVVANPATTQNCNGPACACGPANGGPAVSIEPTNAQKCAAPAPTVVAPVTENAPNWRWTWQCAGGGWDPADNAACAKKRTAVCGPDNGVITGVAPTDPGLCNAGTPSAVAGGAGAPWTWTCDTGAGGTIANCTAPIGAPVNGVCGTAHNTLLGSAPAAATRCTTGTAAAFAGIGPWTWTCNGSGGGTNANCSTRANVTGTGCAACPFGSHDVYNMLGSAASVPPIGQQGAQIFSFCDLPSGIRGRVTAPALAAGSYPWVYRGTTGANNRGPSCSYRFDNTGRSPALPPLNATPNPMSWIMETTTASPRSWTWTGVQGAANAPANIAFHLRYSCIPVTGCDEHGLETWDVMRNRQCAPTDVGKYILIRFGPIPGAPPGISNRPAWFRCE